MIKVTSGSGNTHVLHIKAVVIHLAPLPVVMHHVGRQHSGKMVSIIIIDSPEMIFCGRQHYHDCVFPVYPFPLR